MPAKDAFNCISYHSSTLNPDFYIDQLNREIQLYCDKHGLKGEEARQPLISVLLRRAGTAAFQGASRVEGGPFGAMLVDFNTENGIPEVVGFGTNHVVPASDPSAHGEMTAIRDTAKRLGHTDLSGLTLLTSCECCPMCLSAATGCKVDQVYFAATREDAAAAGFSDADQYRLMTVGGIEQHAQMPQDEEAAEKRLEGHDAVVTITHKGKAYSYYGDYATADAADPTDLPVIQAIRNACRGLAALQGKESGETQNVFHLPENTQIISRRMPHPLSLVAADWARIGRVRGADPSRPEDDSPCKDTTRILYLDSAPEEMPIYDRKKQLGHVAAARIWDEIKHPSAIHVTAGLGNSHKVAFQEWDRLIRTGFMPRY